MSSVDLLKLVKEWYSKSLFNKRKVELRDDKIILDQLNLTAGEVTWTPLDKKNETKSPVNIEIVKAPQGAEGAAPQIQVARKSDLIVKATLETGIIKGLNKMLSLQLPNGHRLKKYVGNCVKINIGKNITEIKKDEMTISVALEVKGLGFSTTTDAKKESFTDQFECSVAISGKVLIHDAGVVDQMIHEVIGELPTPGFQVGKNEVTFKLKGKIEFLRDYEHNLVWDDAQS